MTSPPCIYCVQNQVVKNGQDDKGWQRYKCTYCGKTFTINSKQHPDNRRSKRLIAHLLLLGYKVDKISAEMGISESQLVAWQRKYLPKLDEMIKPGKLIDIHYACKYVSALDKGSRPDRVNKNQSKSPKSALKRTSRKR